VYKDFVSLINYHQNLLHGTSDQTHSYIVTLDVQMQGNENVGCVSEFGTHFLAFRGVTDIGTFCKMIRCSDGTLWRNLRWYKQVNGYVGEGRDSVDFWRKRKVMWVSKRVKSEASKM
jgi:hypothetical protein